VQVKLSNELRLHFVTHFLAEVVPVKCSVLSTELVGDILVVVCLEMGK